MGFSDTQKCITFGGDVLASYHLSGSLWREMQR